LRGRGRIKQYSGKKEKKRHKPKDDVFAEVPQFGNRTVSGRGGGDLKDKKLPNSIAISEFWEKRMRRQKGNDL